MAIHHVGATTRQDLHDLIDALPERDFQMTRLLIEGRHELATDRILFLHATAEWDDEPLTEAEDAAVQEGLADIEAGRVYTLEEVKRELGL